MWHVIFLFPALRQNRRGRQLGISSQANSMTRVAACSCSSNRPSFCQCIYNTAAHMQPRFEPLRRGRELGTSSHANSMTRVAACSWASPPRSPHVLHPCPLPCRRAASLPCSPHACNIPALFSTRALHAYSLPCMHIASLLPSLATTRA